MKLKHGRPHPALSSVALTGLLISGMAAMLLAGCSRSDYPLVPVSGRVTAGGVGKEGVHVSFQPIAGDNRTLDAGPGSFGVTDGDGRYQLKTFDRFRLGAVAGAHRVRLTIAGAEQDPTDDAMGPSAGAVPTRYTDGSLVFEVPPGGTDQASFDLSVP